MDSSLQSFEPANRMLSYLTPGDGASAMLNRYQDGDVPAFKHTVDTFPLPSGPVVFVETMVVEPDRWENLLSLEVVTRDGWIVSGFKDHPLILAVRVCAK
jgi:hypothetical protein